MNQNCKVSFVVPIYNVENYLHKCLQSIAEQTYHNFEVLMINDGSTDSSRSIAEEFTKQDLRFILIDRENGGLSAARNTGLKHITGDAVVFVDSDDYIDPDFTSLCLARMQDTGSDMVCCRLQYDNPFTGVSHIYGHTLPGNVLIQDEIAINALIVKDIHTPVWAKIYSREFLQKHNLSFQEGIVNEDTLFTSLVTLNATKVAFVDRSLYHSLERPGSISRSAQDKLISDMEKALSIVHDYMENSGLMQQSKLADAYYTRYTKAFLYNLLQAVQRLPYNDFKKIHAQCMAKTNYRKNEAKAKMLPLTHRIMFNLSCFPRLFKISFKALNLCGFKMH